jgi:hypothetical protein
MTEFARLAGPAPLEYRYALDAAMPVLASAGPPLVLCNVPELEHEVRQRVAQRAGAARVDAALWVEPLLQSWQVDLAFLSDVLSEGGPLVVVASRPLARTLPERRPWGGRPLGFAPGGVWRLRRALTPAGLTLEGTYGLHAAPAVWLSLLSRLAERWGRPDLGDRLHFAARLRYCASGRLAAWSTVALLVARKEYA